MTITFLALDHGRAALWQPPNGKSVLIDAGGPGDAPAVMRFLKRRKIAQLDNLVVSTWMDRCVGGGPELVRGFPIRQITYNSNFHATPAGKSLYLTAQKLEAAHKLRTGMPAPGDRIMFSFTPPCALEVVAPTGPMLKQFDGLPDCSVMTELSYEKISFFNLGESTRKLQQAMWKQVSSTPRGQVLSIGRGGSEDALLASMLKPLQTRIAILPIPKKSGDRPAPATLAALKRAGVRVYRTDRDGAVTVSTDGQNLEVRAGER